MKEKTKKIIRANFLLLLGIGLFVFNLFSFGSGVRCDCGFNLSPNPLSPNPLKGCGDEYSYPATFYYYNRLTLILLAIGAVFIVIGLLKMSKENYEPKK